MVITDNIRHNLLNIFRGHRGWIAEVAKRAGVHRNTVYNVVHKGHRNDEVVEHVLNYAEEIKANQDELEKRAGNI